MRQANPSRPILTEANAFFALLLVGLFLMALPYEFASGRLRRGPHLLFIGSLAATVFMVWQPLLASIRQRNIWLLTAALAFALLALGVWRNGSAPKVQMVQTVIFPVAFLVSGYLLGMRGARWLIVAILGWVACNLAVSWYTVLTSPPVRDFRQLQVSELFMFGRLYLSQLTNNPVTATGLNASAIMAAGCLMLALRGRGLLTRLVALALFGALVGLAFYTETRGALIAIILACLAVWTVLLIKERSWKYLVSGAAVLILLATATLFVELPERFSIDYYIERGFTGRPETWLDRWTNLPKHPLGSGQPDSYVLGFTCHNQLLEFFSTFGWAVGVVWLLLYGLWACLTAKILVQRDPWGLHATLAAASLAVVAHGLIESHVVSTPSAFWSFAFCYGAMAATVPAPRTEENPGRRRAPRAALVSAARPELPSLNA